MSWEIRQGDALERLREMPDGSVHCCVTSPPYWGLRDYGTVSWEGGDPACEHRVRDARSVSGGAGKQYTNVGSNRVSSGDCLCGAKRVDRQMGLEQSPEEYVAGMVQVFAEVRRALRDDGTLWLNLGDSYTSGGRIGHGAQVGDKQQTNRGSDGTADAARPPMPPGLKPKDLCGIPWRVAFALQADGWWLRSDMPWVKRNAMPESVTDRPANAVEYVFLLAKSKRYFYDAEAVKMPAAKGHAGSRFDTGKTGINGQGRVQQGERTDTGSRSFRNSDPFFASFQGLYTEDDGEEPLAFIVNPQAFKDAHFATFSPKLVEPCIKAGTSERGCCPACGKPWRRVGEKTRTFESGSGRSGNDPVGKNGAGLQGGGATGDVRRGPVVHSTTTGWQPGCTCPAHDPIPCTVLDPFSGAGTTVLVADRLGRHGIGIELNPEYVEMARRRLEDDMPLFAREVAV